MNIQIRYQSQIKSAAGVAGEEIELRAAAGLRELIDTVVARHGDKLRSALFAPEGKLQPTILVFVGDNQVDAADESLHLVEGDVVTLLAPMAGG